MGFMRMMPSPQLYREIFAHQFFEMIIEPGGGFLIFFIFHPETWGR